MENEEREMRLPEGKTCGDCVHFERCNKLVGSCVSWTSCDFHPSRFQEVARLRPEDYKWRRLGCALVVIVAVAGWWGLMLLITWAKGLL